MGRKLHPLHDADWVAKFIESTGEYPGPRKTGRSTARALRLIAEAISAPETGVNITDHESGMPAQKFADTVVGIVRKLGLRHLHVAQYSNLGGSARYIVFSKTCPTRSKILPLVPEKGGYLHPVLRRIRDHKD